MFDTKTLKLIKQIDVGAAQPVTFDSKTNHILTMSLERGPAPPPPPGGGRGAQGTPIPSSFTILVIGK